MNSMRFLTTVQLSILVACKAGGDTDPPTTPPEETGIVDTDPLPPTVDTGSPPTDTDLVACVDLAFSPSDGIVEAGSTLVVTPSGGTGGYVWSVVGEGSITSSGIYSAPATPGVDTIELRDTGCTGLVSGLVDVVPAFLVEPAAANVLPGSVVSFGVTGGSGSHGCAVVQSASGGSLSGCTFTAGSAEGLDLIEVSDDETGSAFQSILTVSSDTVLEPVGSVGWMVPVGARFEPEITGGSGFATLTVADSTLASSGQDPDGTAWISGTAGGFTTVTVEDTYVSGLEISRQLVVLPAFVPPTHHGTSVADDPRALSKDLDGDGYPELLLSIREISALAHLGGIVAIYQGTANGPDIASGPIHLLEGDQDLQHLGEGIALGDLDGDGLDDLVVGAPGVFFVANAVGEISVYAGDGTGHFAAEPFFIARGSTGNDRLGSGVAVCDINGDGTQDLVASTQKREPTTQATSAGGVQFYLNDPVTGLSANPEIRYGVRQVGADWVPVTTGRSGDFGFAAGDLDHDGLCDVAIALDQRDWATDASGAGFVLVFSGDSAEGLSLEPTAVLHPNGGDTGVRFGRYLTIGQIDGTAGPSGLPDDLLIGARGLDDNGNSSGGAFAFLGSPTAPLVRTVADADWSLRGVGGNDLVGDGVGVATDGDLIVAVRGERRVLRIPGGVDFSTGDFVLDVLPANALSLEALVEDTENAASQGLAVTEFGDGVFMVSTFDRELPDGTWEAVDARGLHGVLADGTTTTWLLGRPSGHLHGRSAARFDVDGDGSRDLIVGGPEYTSGLFSALSGVIHVQYGSSWEEFGTVGPSWGGGDRRGWAMATGNFGAGADDLIVAARTDSRPDMPVLDVSCGDGSRSSTGHVAVYTGGGPLADAPSFIWWPPENSVRPETVVAGSDIDGDGLGDLVVGLSDDSFAVVYGVADAPAGQIHELCRFDLWDDGPDATDVGLGVAPLGDLDGDGCDEAAVSAPRADANGVSDVGAVHVLWGFGPTCARTVAEFTTHTLGVANGRIGQSLAGGVDVDGDGVLDLAVGGTNRSVGNNRIGDAAVVSGAYLAGFVGQSAPAAGAQIPNGTGHPLLQTGLFSLNGMEPSADFGRSVGLIDSGSGPWLAVGSPNANQETALRTGGVSIHRISGGQPETLPSWWIAGESQRNDSDFGRFLTTDGRDLLIGAPGSGAMGNVHTGATYVAPL